MTLLPPGSYTANIRSYWSGRRWTDWFEGLTIELQESGETLLTGPVVDQPALHGLPKKVRDPGLPLVSVTRVEALSRRAAGSLKEECSEGE